MRASLSVSINRRRASSSALVVNPSRHYSVIQKGHDVHQRNLFHTLGFGRDDELRMLYRTPEELKLGMVREVKKLDDPSNMQPTASSSSSSPLSTSSPPLAAKEALKVKKEKVKSLKQAFRKLNDPVFRSQYVPYHCSSVDVNLHVLCEGGQHCTNYNPEHETLDFTSASQLPQRSFGEFKEAFQQATHTHAAKAAAYDATVHLAPKDGPDIQATLHISFQEAMDGCSKSLMIRRFVKCKPCLGSGDRQEKRPKKCPQCGGNGVITLPSATYVIKKPCDHCLGKGVLPPPRCSSCKGTGTTSIDDRIEVDVAPCTHTGLEQQIANKGQSGTRGGKTGHLVVTYLVEEHRWFHRIGLDLHIALPIPLSTAMLGGYVQVPLLSGEYRSVYIPAALKNGEIVNVEGCGIRQVKEGGTEVTGALRIHTIVVVPKGDALTGQQKAALRSISSAGSSTSASTTAQEEPNKQTHVNELTGASMSFEEAKKSFRSWLTNN